jgi:probable HAF family extracellular repeat protein
LGTLGGNDSKAYGIDDSGQVVGGAYTASGDEHAFLYCGGKMIDLDTLPGGSTSSAYGISNNGQVVGYSNTASGEQHAFLYSGGTMTDLNNLVGLPSGVYLFEARAISDFGQIAANGSNAHAYL